MSNYPKSFWDGLAQAASDMVASAEQGEHSHTYEPISKYVESPIERTLAMTLLCHWRMSGEWMTLYQRKASDAAPTLRTANLIAQAPIGSYRVDFLLQSAVLPEAVKIVIECDGHDFHERTKEQAARDRSRDRTLTGLGYTVLRFTGSEIHRDPWECAREVYTHYDGRFCDAYVRSNVRWRP